MGLYPGRDDYQGSDTVYLDAYRRTATPSAGYVSKGAAIAVAAIATLLLLVLAFIFRRRRTGRLLRADQAGARPSRTQPLWPPSPIAFDRATSRSTFRASFGT